MRRSFDRTHHPILADISFSRRVGWIAMVLRSTIIVCCLYPCYKPLICMKPQPPPTFFQLFKEHFRGHGSLLAADAGKMLLLFIAPSIVLVGLKLLTELGHPSKWLDWAETVDSFVVFAMILILSFDTLGKMAALTFSGWRTWFKTNSQTSS
jgi:hypothetical protein